MLQCWNQNQIPKWTARNWNWSHSPQGREFSHDQPRRVNESLEDEGTRRGLHRALITKPTTSSINLDNIVDPESWNEAIASNQRNEWTEAAWSEWEPLLSNGAFEFIPRQCLEARSLATEPKWVPKARRVEYGESRAIGPALLHAVITKNTE